MMCDRVDSAREGVMEMKGNGGMDREMCGKQEWKWVVRVDCVLERCKGLE